MSKVILPTLILTGLFLGACSSSSTTSNQQLPVTKEPTMTTTSPTATSLEIKDLKVGDGAEAVEGATVSVHYTGTLTDGTKFDSSVDRGEPFSFTLGAGEVIAGWDQGVAGMKVGGKRQLTIPPELGYGSRDLGTIPPNSTLVFEVELIAVE